MKTAFLGFLLLTQGSLPIGQKIIQTALAYGVDPEAMIQLGICESGLNPKAWNKKDPNGGSKSVFQYQSPTFYGAAKEVGIENPDVWNVDQQIELTAYLLSQGRQNLWTCAKGKVF